MVHMRPVPKCGGGPAQRILLKRMHLGLVDGAVVVLALMASFIKLGIIMMAVTPWLVQEVNQEYATGKRVLGANVKWLVLLSGGVTPSSRWTPTRSVSLLLPVPFGMNIPTS